MESTLTANYRRKTNNASVGFYQLKTACGACFKNRHRVCKKCGATQLAWDDNYNSMTGRWRLMMCADGPYATIERIARNGEVHICDPVDVARMDAQNAGGGGMAASDAQMASIADMSSNPTTPEQVEQNIEMLYATLRPHVQSDIALALPEIDVDAIGRNAAIAAEAAAREAVAAMPAKEIRLVLPDGTVKSTTKQHWMFDILVRLLAARLNVFLAGPAGSGKTRVGDEASKLLSLKFFPKSMGPATTEYAMMGFMNAAGAYSPGIARDPFENGGVLLLDEMDSANAAALTTMNTMMANEYCSFPDAVVRKHEDFVLIASGNTYGRGANRKYSGRTQLDAATLNRFFFIEWPYDDAMESDIALSMAQQYDSKFKKPDTDTFALPAQPFTWTVERSKQEIAEEIYRWMHYVQDVRRSVEANHIDMVVGTRDIIDGSKAIAAGFTLDAVAHMRFWTASGDDNKRKVQAGMKVAI